MNKKITLVGLALLGLSQISNAQWAASTSGLTTSSVDIIAYNGSNLFAASDAGLFISDNSGGAWTKATDSIMANSDIHALTTSGSTIFASAGTSGVYRSMDNGVTWTLTNSSMMIKYCEELTAHNNVIYASIFYSGLYTSSDNGGTWTKVSDATLGSAVVTAVVNVGSNVFAGTEDENGVFKSTDDGANWTQVNSGLTDNRVNDLAVIGTKLYAATPSGVFVSSDNGAMWTELAGLGVGNATALAVVGSNLIVGTPYGIYSLNEAGTTFTDISTGVGAANLSIEDFVATETNLFAGNVYHADGVVKRALSELGSTTSVESNAVSSVSVNPNPSNGVVKVSGVSGAYSIEVYNALGVLVHSQNNQATVDLSGVGAGVYVVKVIQGADLSSTRLVLN